MDGDVYIDAGFENGGDEFISRGIIKLRSGCANYLRHPQLILSSYYYSPTYFSISIIF